MIRYYNKQIIQWTCEAGYVSWGGGHLLCSYVEIKDCGAEVGEIIVAGNMEDVGYISRDLFIQMMEESGLSRESLRLVIRENWDAVIKSFGTGKEI